ncbi:hypothetical protein LMIY3S_05777 [Labrys miyagiensis]
MLDQISVDTEYDLEIPSHLLLDSIVIGVELVPNDASVVFLGWDSDGNLSRVNVIGSQERLSLPFIHRHIAAKATSPVLTVVVSLLGFNTAPGKPFRPPQRIGSYVSDKVSAPPRVEQQRGVRPPAGEKA